MMKSFFSVTFFLIFSIAQCQVKEPYKPVNNGSFSGAKVPQSPDPLVAYRWKDPKVSDALQTYQLQPKFIKASNLSSFVIPAANLANTTGITVNGKGDLLFDFGVESAGWLEFESDDLVDSVDMSISEYNEPAVVNAGAQNPVKTKVPKKYGNIYRLELNSELYEGVRFGWIHVKQFTKQWHIKKVRLVCQVRPTNYNGSFWCNDTMLTRIWYTGAYTVKLNLLKDFFGAILMERSDRQSWTGDAYPSQAAALVAFGNYDMVKANLTFTSKQDDNGIAAYSLYWVLSLIDYYNYTGDKAFFDSLSANADARLMRAYNNYDSAAHLGFMGWDERLGAGFENPQATDAQNAYRMLCLKTWSRFAKTAALVGNAQLAGKYQDFANAKALTVKDDLVSTFNVHALSEAIDGGIVKSARLQQDAAVIFKDRNNRLSYSPFNQYFIIQAMAAAGYYTPALAAIKDCWGGQIKYGGSTFFEVYRPSWNSILKTNDAPPNNQCGYTSLAHPWSAGVTKWLSEEILGIKPETAGFTTFSIVPHLSAAVTSVKGTMPTPHGFINAAFNTVSGDCYITIPAGTKASRIGIPKNGRRINSIVVNGKPAYKSGSASIENNDFVYLQNLQPGTYKIKVNYSDSIWNGNELENSKKESKVNNWNFPISDFTQDSVTSGNWQAKYGKDGYVFFGYGENENAKKLPAYIQAIKTDRNAVVVWDSLAADKRAISIGNTHRAAAIITQDPLATLQTMTIDVKITDTLEHRLSLYFVDYDKKERRSAIEIFDLNTLNILAPVQLVQHYENGKYISFTCRQSVRIRINHVRGKNAALSGLFFE